MASVKQTGVYVSIGADTSGLESGIARAQGIISSIGGLSSVISIAVNTAGIGYSIRQFANLESELNTLRGISNATQQDLTAMAEKAKSLGSSTSWTASEVAQGMSSLARMGFGTTEIIESISSVMDAAKGMSISIEDAATMIGSTLNQFNAGADAAEHYADVLAAVTNSAAISGTEIADSMRYAGTAGAAIGQSVETVSALIAQLRNAGLSSEQAGTSIRNFMTLLQDDSKLGAFEKAFNVTVKDAQGNFRDLAQVLSEAQDNARAMGQSLSAELQKVGVNITDVNAVQILLNNGKAADKMAASLKAVDGYASSLAGTMDGGLTGSYKMLNSAMEGLAITVGDLLSGDAKTWINMATDGVTAVNNFAKSHEGLTKWLLKTIPLLTVAAKLVSSFKNAKFTLGQSAGGGGFSGLAGSQVSGNTTTSIAQRATSQEQELARLYQIQAESVAESRKAMNDLIQTEVAAGNVYDSTTRTIRDQAGNIVWATDQLDAYESHVGNMAIANRTGARTVQEVADATDNFTRRLQRAERGMGLTARAGRFLKTTLKELAKATAITMAIEGVLSVVKEMYRFFSKSADEAERMASAMEKQTDEMKKQFDMRTSEGSTTDAMQSARDFVQNSKNFSTLSAEDKAAWDKQAREYVRAGLLTEDQVNRARAGNLKLNEDNFAKNVGQGKYNEAADVANEITAKKFEEMTKSLFGFSVSQSYIAYGSEIAKKLNRGEALTDKEAAFAQDMGIAKGSARASKFAFAGDVLANLDTFQKNVKVASMTTGASDLDIQKMISEAEKNFLLNNAESLKQKDYLGAGFTSAFKDMQKFNEGMSEYATSYIDLAKGLASTSNEIDDNIKDAKARREYKAEETDINHDFGFLNVTENELATARAVAEAEAVNEHGLTKAEQDLFDDLVEQSDALAESFEAQKDKLSESIDALDDLALITDEQSQAGWDAVHKQRLKENEVNPKYNGTPLTADRMEAIMSGTVSPAQVKDLLARLAELEKNGVDVSGERNAIRDRFKSGYEEAVESLKGLTPTMSFNTKIFTDSISAAFSASSGSVNIQQDQLKELQKMYEKASQQYAATTEILNLL